MSETTPVHGAARGGVPFYSYEQLAEVADLCGLMDYMAEAHRLGAPHTGDRMVGPPGTQLFVRAAVMPGQAMGAKIISLIPANAQKGGRSIQAVFVLFDADTGDPQAVLEATGLTYWKTAADSALGARYLAREDARCLLMVGAGDLAPWLVRAHLQARPGVDRVLIWNRTGHRAAELAQRLAIEGIPAASVAELAPAAAQADIISTATMTRTPLIRGEWLRPGTHLDLVGAYDEGMREADDDCFRGARVYADYRASALDVGEILTPLASGAMAGDGLLGDHYDLARGAPGRLSPADITIFKNAGGGHLDLMTAAFLLSRVRRGGRG